MERIRTQSHRGSGHQRGSGQLTSLHTELLSPHGIQQDVNDELSKLPCIQCGQLLSSLVTQRGEGGVDWEERYRALELLSRQPHYMHSKNDESAGSGCGQDLHESVSLRSTSSYTSAANSSKSALLISLSLLCASSIPADVLEGGRG